MLNAPAGGHGAPCGKPGRRRSLLVCTAKNGRGKEQAPKTTPTTLSRGRREGPGFAERRRDAAWSRDGQELLFVEDNKLMVAQVGAGERFEVGEITRLFESRYLNPTGTPPAYDVSADGQRFVLIEPVGYEDEPEERAIHIIQNWYEEFRDREQD